MRDNSKLKAALRANAIPLTIGGGLGFLFALFYEWLMMNLMINFYSLYYVIIVITFILAFILIFMSMYLLYNGHAIAGAFCMVAGWKLLNWVLQWYLPLCYDGYWGSFGWFF